VHLIGFYYKRRVILLLRCLEDSRNHNWRFLSD